MTVPTCCASSCNRWKPTKSWSNFKGKDNIFAQFHQVCIFFGVLFTVFVVTYTNCILNQGTGTPIYPLGIQAPGGRAWGRRLDIVIYLCRYQLHDLIIRMIGIVWAHFYLYHASRPWTWQLFSWSIRLRSDAWLADTKSLQWTPVDVEHCLCICLNNTPARTCVYCIWLCTWVNVCPCITLCSRVSVLHTHTHTHTHTLEKRETLRP